MDVCETWDELYALSRSNEYTPPSLRRGMGRNFVAEIARVTAREDSDTMRAFAVLARHWPVGGFLATVLPAERSEVAA